VAPPVRDLRISRLTLPISKRIPHLRMLPHQPKGHLLASAADEDRHRARGPRLQLLDSLFDPWQRVPEGAQPITRLPEVESVFVVIALEPSRPEPEDEPSSCKLI